MIRQFTLINDNGSRMNLNSPDTFGYKPEGLGISFANTYYGANGNFIPESLGVEQSSFTIQVLLGADSGEHYRKFAELADFLNYPPYALEYKTDAGSWLRDAQLKGFDKSELNEWSVIDTKLELEFTTPWYRWILGGTNFNPDDKLNRGKIYINNGATNNKGYYTYGYVYGADLDNTTGDGYFSINNTSQYFGVSSGSPVEITIDGPATNPHWEVYKDNQLMQSDAFFLDVPKDYKLIVSSIPQQQRALLFGNGDSENVYQSQDITKTNFVTIPTGNVTVYIDSGGSSFTWRMREERLVV